MAKSHSVGIASKAHFNTVNSPSAEASLVVETKGGYPRIPKIIGIRKVNIPKTNPLLLFFLNVFRSISKPAKNMM